MRDDLPARRWVPAALGGLLGILFWIHPGPGAGTANAGELAAETPGTQLRIEGPISVYGQAPLPLDPLPPGRYRLSLEGPGLARTKGNLDLSSTGSLVARSWSGPEAFLFPPGATHFAKGERWRGFVLFGGGVLSGTAALVQETWRSDAADQARIRGDLYRNAYSEDDIAEAELFYRNASQEEQDHEELRNLWAGYFAATWVGAALEAWILTPRPRLSSSSAEGQVIVTGARAGGFAAGFRSALVPGSGQRYLGHDRRANLFATAVLSLAAGTLFVHASYLDSARDQALAQGRYDLARSESELESRRRDLESASEDRDSWDTARKTVAGITVGMYLWNVLDAVLSADSGPSAPAATSIHLSPTRDGFAAALTRRIP